MTNRHASTAKAFSFALSVACAACHDQGPPESVARVPLPLTNGIVFESKRADTLGDVFTMNLDGTNVQRLTDASARDVCPSISPDGNLIAFYRKPLDDPNLSFDLRRDSLALMNADGTAVRMLAATRHYLVGCPIWAPDSRAIAVHEERHSPMGSTPTFEVRTFALDGGLLAEFSKSGLADLSFSPDGSRFVGTAFGVSQCCGSLGHRVITIAIDGTDSRELAAGQSPSWSPVRNAIVYRCGGDSMYSPAKAEICVVADDGTGPRTIVANQPDRQFFERPSFTSDGSTVALRCETDLCVVDLQSGAVTRSSVGVFAWEYTWTPDNQRLIFMCSVAPVYDWDICAIRRDGTGFINLTNDRAVDDSPSLSPGGA
jgi:Tol biopolymer transport system component